MSATFVMTLDSVLRNPGSEGLNQQGLALYRALSSTGRLAVLCGPDETRDEWFLASNGLTKHAYLVPEETDSAYTSAARRMNQIIYLRSQGCIIEFVIEPDPAVAVHLFTHGVPVMVYLHPQYSTPSFRPDYESVAKPWDNLVKQVDYQMAMRAQAALNERELDED